MSTSIDVSGVIRSNDRVRDEVSRVNDRIRELERSIERLTETTQNVQKQIELQTQLQKELELIEAEATLDEARQIQVIEQQAVISAEQKLMESKGDIFRDFVKAIKDQIKQFKNLVANELDRLSNIISGRDKVERILRAVDPLKDDREMMQQTQIIYQNRQNLATGPLREISSQVGSFVQERRDLKTKIDNLFISNPSFDHLSNGAVNGEIYILELPLWIAGFATQSTDKADGKANRHPEFYRIYSNLVRDESKSPSLATVPNELANISEFMSNIDQLQEDEKMKKLLQATDLMNYDLEDQYNQLLTQESNGYIRKAVNDHYLHGGDL